MAAVMTILRAALRTHAAKALAVGLFALPALMVGNGGGNENRTLADLPALEWKRAALLAYPGQLDQWINDHFGWRRELIALHTHLRYALLREFPTVQAISGRHGRIFLAAHNTSHPPYSAITNVCGPGPVYDGVTVAASYLNRFFGDLRSLGFDPRMLVVPSSPVVEHQDLPPWLARRCATEATPVADVLASPLIAPGVRAQIRYPLAEMRMWKEDEALYPKTWFHWAGSGLAKVVDYTMPALAPEGVPNAAPLPTRADVVPSDISHLLGGIRFSSPVVVPDFAKAGINACYGASCYPEFGEAGALMPDVSRMANPNAPRKRRLLILSDSFGSKISAWYARYYQTVEQVCGNDIPRLNGPQLAQVRQWILRAPQDTDVLILYHDGSAIHKAIRRGMTPIHTGVAEKP